MATAPEPRGIVFSRSACALCQADELLKPTTADCPCLVCVDCAVDALENGVCGVCGTWFTEHADGISS